MAPPDPDPCPGARAASRPSAKRPCTPDEAAQPHEAVVAVEVAELAHHRHARRFLRDDKLVVEHIDEGVAPTGMQGVPAQLDDGAGRGWGHRGLLVKTLILRRDT